MKVLNAAAVVAASERCLGHNFVEILQGLSMVMPVPAVAAADVWRPP